MLSNILPTKWAPLPSILPSDLGQALQPGSVHALYQGDPLLQGHSPAEQIHQGCFVCSQIAQ